MLRARTGRLAPPAVLFAILFALFTSPAPVSAQGTAADYRRAAMLETLYREARAGREITPIWTPEGDLITRRFGALAVQRRGANPARKRCAGGR